MTTRLLLRLVWKGVVIACVASATLPAQQSATVVISGEFRENGSCAVFANGVPVFRPADSAQTTYIRDGTLNLAPDGFETHEIWCAPRSEEQPMPPTDSTGRVLVVMLYAPTGKLAQPRSYEVRLGLPSAAVAPCRAGAALFGMSRQVINDTLPLRMGLMYLAGSSGTVVITRVNAAHIVGTFSIRTRRAMTL